MALKELIKEARKKIESAKNPLYFYDDDPDGLSSFLILMRAFKKGYGVPVKRNDEGQVSVYISKIDEKNPDLVVTLDKPMVTQDIIDQINVPVIIVDHHPVNDVKGAKYINPRIYDDKDNRPTTYWAYKIADEPEDSNWIAATGIVADYFLPEDDFMKKFKYRELIGNSKSPAEALYEHEIGILVKVLSFIQKGRTSEVRKYANLMLGIKSPYEILRQESEAGKNIWKKYLGVNKEYESLLKKALGSNDDGKLLVFNYQTSSASLTGVLSNELLYRCKSKVIIVARANKDRMLISLRSKGPKIEPVLREVLKITGGSGGGHDYACGANIDKGDFEKFVELIRKGII
ncbi:MAG: DHHA1 domain-containing protein [Nanoarchaeota archaeon]